MTSDELLAAVGLPADTVLSSGDMVLVDTLRTVAGYTSAGRMPEADALTILDDRLGWPDTEGYLFAAEGDELVLVIADTHAILDITPVSRPALMRDLRQHLHHVQGILRRLQGTRNRSSLRR